MATTTKPRNLLLVGLVFDAEIPAYFRTAYGPPSAIEDAVRQDEERARRGGFELVELQIDPALREEGLSEFKGYLESGNFDAIMIGGGIRLIPEQTALFETMVNMCRTIVPGTPLMFNGVPGTMTKCLERLFGARFDE